LTRIEEFEIGARASFRMYFSSLLESTDDGELQTSRSGTEKLVITLGIKFAERIDQVHKIMNSTKNIQHILCTQNSLLRSRCEYIGTHS